MPNPPEKHVRTRISSVGKKKVSGKVRDIRPKDIFRKDRRPFEKGKRPEADEDKEQRMDDGNREHCGDRTNPSEVEKAADCGGKHAQNGKHRVFYTRSPLFTASTMTVTKAAVPIRSAVKKAKTSKKIFCSIRKSPFSLKIIRNHPNRFEIRLRSGHYCSLRFYNFMPARPSPSGYRAPSVRLPLRSFFYTPTR